jgi:hypothetical protein
VSTCGLIIGLGKSLITEKVTEIQPNIKIVGINPATEVWSIHYFQTGVIGMIYFNDI